MGDNNLDLEAEDAQLRSLDLRRFGFRVDAPQQGNVGGMRTALKPISPFESTPQIPSISSWCS